MNKKSKNNNNQNILISRFIFTAYLIVVAYVMFFAEDFGRVSGSMEYRYNITPFMEIKRFFTLINNNMLKDKAWLNLAGNIVVFIPFGMFFPMLRKKSTGMINTVILTFTFSTMIEAIQLYTKLGVFDVDDIILNTSGGIIGYLLYIICRSLLRRQNK